MPQHCKVHRDLHLYHRCFKLLDYFEFSNSQERVPFITPSSREPDEEAVSLQVQWLIQKDITAFQDFKFKQYKSRNISPEETIALRNLKRRTNLHSGF